MLKKFQDAAKQIGEKLNEGAKSMQKVYAGAVEEVECPECHAVAKFFNKIMKVWRKRYVYLH